MKILCYLFGIHAIYHFCRGFWRGYEKSIQPEPQNTYLHDL